MQRMSVILCLLLGLGLFAPLAAQDEDVDLKGHDAPELEASTWMNSDEPITLESLRGQVVVLYFWGVW